MRSDDEQRCEQGCDGMAPSSRRRARGSRPPWYNRSSSRGVPHIGPGSASQRCGQGSRSSGRYSRRFERCSRCRAPVASSERPVDSSSRKSGSSAFGVGAAGARAPRIVAIRGAGGRRRSIIRNDVRQHASRSMSALCSGDVGDPPHEPPGFANGVVARVGDSAVAERPIGDLKSQLQSRGQKAECELEQP